MPSTVPGIQQACVQHEHALYILDFLMYLIRLILPQISRKDSFYKQVLLKGKEVECI